MTISLDKKYTTRDGRPVRIYQIDGGHPWTVHGAIMKTEGRWDVATWMSDGSISAGVEMSRDLIELKPMRRVVGWLNVDPSFRPKEPNAQGLFESRGIADCHALSTRIACIHIDVETEDLSHG